MVAIACFIGGISWCTPLYVELTESTERACRIQLRRTALWAEHCPGDDDVGLGLSVWQQIEGDSLGRGWGDSFRSDLIF